MCGLRLRDNCKLLFTDIYVSGTKGWFVIKKTDFIKLIKVKFGILSHAKIYFHVVYLF